MKKFITVDSQLVKDSDPILDELGIDIDVVVKMTLKRIIKDKSISFITDNMPRTLDLNNNNSFIPASNDKMTKSIAISLFRNKGIYFNKNITFASKNKSAYNYWANPNFDSLYSDWFLILNDSDKKELHLFTIPANSIKPNSLVCRADQIDKIDLQIYYNDPTFTDGRSKVSFSKFLTKSISY